MVPSAPYISAQESTPAAGTTVQATPDAEATPETAATPAAEATDTLGTVLMSYDFEELPQAPMTVRLLRITLAPGATVPMHTHPGPEFDLVESGTLTAQVDGTAVTSVDGEQSETSEPQSLSAGSWIMYPDGAGMSLSNEGTEDVVILSAVILAVDANGETITYTDGEPTDADFEGVSFVVLGDGLIQQFPAGPATVTVDELAVTAGEPVPGYSGAALVSKTAGQLAFAAGEGDVQVTRTATPQLQPNAIPEQEFTLNDNDAAFFPNGYEAIERPESDSELTLTRLLIQPEGELANAPAVVNSIQPAETAETADSGQTEGDGLGIGAVIALSEDAVRIRADATTTSEIIKAFPVGTRFELTDGPVEGENYVWYQVQGVGDLSDVQGWLVTDFMDVIEPAPADAEQEGTDGSAGSEEAAEEAEATPEATPEAAPQAGATTPEEQPVELEVGATVATTDENVRIREEADTGTDIIVALPTGTELEIIGGPEENQDFTWYEVEVVESGVTGWTVAEFLEPAEGE